MIRLIPTTIVLGIAIATLGVSLASAVGVQSDAPERALPSQLAAVTDAHDRAVTVTPVPTDSHERAQLAGPATGPVVSSPGWDVSWTNLLLGAAIAAGLVLAVVLMVGAIRRYPPRGHPPLAHR